MLPLSYHISILLSIHPRTVGEPHPRMGGEPVIVSGSREVREESTHLGVSLLLISFQQLSFLYCATQRLLYARANNVRDHGFINDVIRLCLNEYI